MDISKVIIYIILIFMVVGIVDKIVFKNRYGYGVQFEEGVMAMGTLAMSMVGIMCFAPVLGKILMPVAGPFYGLFGGDPAMVAGSVLAIDMGGYPLAQAMTDTKELQQLSGLYLGAMMGATVVFSIPVSLGLVKKEDRDYIAKGFLSGFIAVPFGVAVSGMATGISLAVLSINLWPTAVLALLFALGLKCVPKVMMKGFDIFAKLISAFAMICLGSAIIEALSGIKVIPGMDPIGPQLEIVGTLAITLSGAYPMVHFVRTVLSGLLEKLGRFLGVNSAAAAGMIACLANNLPTFSMIEKMDERGKIYSTAFSVCASFALGDHLAYAATAGQECVAPMVLGKICGGIIGVVIARLLVVGGGEKKSACS